MTRPAAPHQRFFAELKRRRVFRVMAVYGIVGFVLIQIVDLAVPALLLPDWTYRFVALLLMIGFPIAVIIAWAFEITPEGLQRTASAPPGEIERIVALPAAKRWPSGVLALLGVALLAAAWWIGRGSMSGTASASADGSGASPSAEMRPALAGAEDEARPTIAVLPFADMSREGDQEYFSDGMTEEILNTLAKIRELKVMARTSALAFNDRSLDMRAVGDSLGVEYLVEGSVRKSGNKLRITAQLIDAADGSHLWTEQYDRELDDVFAIQTEIAEAIAEQLRVPLGLEEGEQLVYPTADLEAYDLYLTGRARMRERGAGVTEAIELFEAAIARDSNWAPAWAGLAESRALAIFYPLRLFDSTFVASSLTAAEQAARRALELDPRNASATVALGNIHRDRWEWDAAEAAYERALAFDPDNVEVHQQYAEFLDYVGRLDEAYAAAHRALALDRSPIRLNVAGYLASANGRYTEAIELLSEGISKDPANRFPALRGNLITARRRKLGWVGAREPTLEYLADQVSPELSEKIAETWPVGGGPTPETATCWGSRRRCDEPPINTSSIFGAKVWAWLGETDRAIDALEGVLRDRSRLGSNSFLFDLAFDPLRDDPRFESILASRGLAGRRPIRLPPEER